MKNRAANSTAVLIGITLVIAGCSNEPEMTTASAADEIRGEPIQELVAAEPEAEDPEAEPVGLPVASIEPVSALETEPPAGDVPKEAIAAETVKEGDMPGDDVVGGEVIRTDGRDYLSVGFDRLASYEFEVTDDLLESDGGNPEDVAKKTNGMIPEPIRNLDASSVAVKGYMLPLKVEQGQVTEFLLMRDQSMCCFGTVPKINEWVSVKTIGPGVKPVMDEPVTIFGRLHVGEIRENGYLVGIYRMDGEKLAGALDL